MRFVTGSVYFAMALAVSVGARADATPADVEHAKKALANIHMEKVWQYMLDGGTDSAVEKDKLPAATAAKIKETCAAALSKELPRLQEGVANTAAAKYSSEQLAGIEKVSAVPAFQQLVANQAMDAAEPDLSTLSEADKAIMDELSEQDFVTGFVVDAIQDQSVDAVITGCIADAAKAQ